MKQNGRKTIVKLGAISSHSLRDCHQNSFNQQQMPMSCSTLCASLINLPFFGNSIFIRAHKQLNRPDDQSKKNVHPAPPNLRRMVQYCRKVSQRLLSWRIFLNIQRRCEQTVTNMNWRQVSRKRVKVEVWKEVKMRIMDDLSNLHTGRPSQPSSTPSSDSQLSAPIVGKILEARWRIVKRYNNAMRTGLGSVLITKLKRASK